MRAGGGGVRKLTNNQIDDSAPAWSPRATGSSSAASAPEIPRSS